VNTSNDERNVYFFMAYLAQKGADLSIDIPSERDDYILVDGPKPGGIRQLQVRVPLSSNVDMPVSVTFAGELDARDVEELAEEMATDLGRLPLRTDEIIDELLELREHAEASFARLRRKRLQLKLISLDFDVQEAIRTNEAAYLLTFEKLRSDAKPSKCTVHVYDADTLDGALGSHFDGQRDRATRARELKKEKADGAIDVALFNRLQRHGIDIRRVIKTPAELRADCAINLPDGEIRLYWEDGVLTANMPLTGGVHWVGGGVDLQGKVAGPKGDLTGRKVSDFITHVDLPDDLIIAWGTARGEKGANFRATLQYLMFDAQTGATW
jgi:hypothetical protein